MWSLICDPKDRSNWDNQPKGTCIKDAQLIGERTEKSQAPGGIQTHDLSVTRGVFYHSTTTAAHSNRLSYYCSTYFRGFLGFIFPSRKSSSLGSTGSPPASSASAAAAFDFLPETKIKEHQKQCGHEHPVVANAITGLYLQVCKNTSSHKYRKIQNTNACFHFFIENT